MTEYAWEDKDGTRIIKGTRSNVYSFARDLLNGCKNDQERKEFFEGNIYIMGLKDIMKKHKKKGE